MGLTYNENTAVERDIKTELAAETEFLNQNAITGRESAIQTEAWSIDSTTTLAYDVIITGCALSVKCADDIGASNANASAEFKGFLLGAISITGDGSTGVSSTLFIPIPNWIARKGEVITISTGGANGSGRAVVIGYVC